MAAEENRVFMALGSLQSEIKSLRDEFLELKADSTAEHRKVHDIVVATSEAMRVLTRTVDEMKPLTDDYREKRAEARGAAKFATMLWVVLGGLIMLAFTTLKDFFIAKPHPIIIAMLLVLSTAHAHAHSWYPTECCHDQDCRPVPCEEIVETKTGFLYGGVSFTKSSERPSQDRFCHVCIMGRAGLCVFTRQGS